jgi:hypothetical protein
MISDQNLICCDKKAQGQTLKHSLHLMALCKKWHIDNKSFISKSTLNFYIINKFLLMKYFIVSACKLFAQVQLVGLNFVTGQFLSSPTTCV